MRINLTTDDFTEVTITSGTLQNISPQASVEVASTATKNTGIILPPYATLSYSDNATVYARNAWDDDSTCVIAVEPFKRGGEGGEYTLPIATSSKLGGVKVGSNLSIDKSGVLSATGGGAVDYSTTEKQIGTWIDGKPLYQISYNINIIIDGAAHNIADCPANVDYIADIDGTFKFSSAGSTGIEHINTYFDSAYSVSVDVWQNKIRCNGKGWAGTHPAVITLQYTKTTD